MGTLLTLGHGTGTKMQRQYLTLLQLLCTSVGWKKKHRRKGLDQQGLKTKNRKCVVYVTVRNELRSQRQSLAFHLHMTNFCFSFDFSFGRAPYVGSPLLFSSHVKLYVNTRHRTFHIMLYTAKKTKR